jgi:hypothetical protein
LFSEILMASSSRSSSAPLLLLLLAPPLAYFTWKEFAPKKHAAPNDEPDGAATGTEPEPGAPLAARPPALPPAASSSATAGEAPDPSAFALPPLGRRLTTSQRVDGGRIAPSDTELLLQARAIDPRLTIDELAGARLIASERGDQGTFAEWLCIVDAEMNRAKLHRQSLYESLTRGAGFGVQGRQRPASTRLDPHEAHVLAARAVLLGFARGIARGAIQFFDPREADRAARRGTTCDAIAQLERWSYDYPMSAGCTLDRAHPGPDTQAWVGPIPGVDASRLMLFARVAKTDPDHFTRYLQALALINQARGAGKAVS